MKALYVFVLLLGIFWSGCTVMQEAPSGTVKRFSDASEFREYLLGVSSYPADSGVRALVGGFTAVGYGADELTPPSPIPPLSSSHAQPAGKPVSADRYSVTNVQVAGVDEPDILKNDGEVLYFSGTHGRGWKGGTLLVGALPPENMSVLSRVPEGGELLLSGSTLLIFSGTRVSAYDVRMREKPQKLWEMVFPGRLVSAREYDDRVYAVVEKRLSPYTPCSMLIATLNGKRVEVECTSLYYPEDTPSDSAYVLLEIEPESGRVLRKSGFTGAAGSSVVYMSGEAVYITYPYRKVEYGGYLTGLEEVLPPDLAEQVRRVREYRISREAKAAEYRRILEAYMSELSDEERAELKQRLYSALHPEPREKAYTGIVKLGLRSFRVEASTTVEGTPLNQFSLDEYRGYLRVALTTGDDNVVKVLDSSSLKPAGEVRNLGKKGERIFGVRFAGDLGYVVTFRRTDPFYVIDLSEPESPAVAGELELPGYSSYLHPLGNGTVLGVGMEGGRVKLSLFDVSRPEEPVEVDRYLLPEGWSEVLRNHRAFLVDAEKQVFFLPAGRYGYLFSYSRGMLVPLGWVPVTGAVRAAYIGEYMYIFSNTEVVAIDERTWKVAGRLGLGAGKPEVWYWK